MAMIKKSITLTPTQNDWIQAQLLSGKYASDSELLRDLIRKEQARIDGTEALMQAVIEGEESGISNRDIKDIMRDVLEKRSLGAKL
jgi:antitoxin ParD1/3/4